MHCARRWYPGLNIPRRTYSTAANPKLGANGSAISRASPTSRIATTARTIPSHLDSHPVAIEATAAIKKPPAINGPISAGPSPKRTANQ